MKHQQTRTNNDPPATYGTLNFSIQPTEVVHIFRTSSNVHGSPIQSTLYYFAPRIHFAGQHTFAAAWLPNSVHYRTQPDKGIIAEPR